MALTYYVRRIVSPWMGGVGDLSGVPLVLVELAKPNGELVPLGQEMTPQDIARAVTLQLTVEQAPAWCLVRGDDAAVDNDLLTHLRVVSSLRVAVEVSGLVPLGVVQGDRTPMFDHVCLRMRLPMKVIAAQIFHSIVVSRATPMRLEAVDADLVKRGFEGRKWIEGEDAPGTVAAYGRGWRAATQAAPEV